MLINPANLRTLYTSFSTAFQGAFSAVTPSYGEVAMTVPSTTRQNEYGWLSQMPRVREWIGDREVKNLSDFGYTIRNRSFELTIGVDRDDLEDDNLGIFNPLFDEMGRAAASFPDELVWPMMAGGFVTPCYDKQNFFDVDHPVLDKNGNVTSVANMVAGSDTPWYLIDDTRSVKPVIFQTRRAFQMTRMDAATDEVVFDRKEYRYGVDGRCNVGFGFWQLAYGAQVPLTPDTYAAAREGMIGMKGDQGRPLGIRPTKLIVPPSLEGAARQILVADRNADGSSNVWQGSAKLSVQSWLA